MELDRLGVLSSERTDQEVTRDEIAASYLILLGRYPESDAVIQILLKLTRNELLVFITSSQEFLQRIRQVACSQNFDRLPDDQTQKTDCAILLSQNGITTCISKESLSVLDGMKIVGFDDGRIAFKKGKNYLSAANGSLFPTFSAKSISSQELFTVMARTELPDIARTYTKIVLKSGMQKIDRAYSLECVSEELKPPLTASEDDSKWFEDSPQNFFAISPGTMIPIPNGIDVGTDKYISTKYGASGVIFDEDGYYHNAGFLNLRSDFDHLVAMDNCFAVDLEALRSKRTLLGSYSAPFDGNSFNYYHWLLEGLLSIFLMKKHGCYNPPILSVGSKGLSKWQSQYIDLLDIKDTIQIDGDVTDIVFLEKVCFLKYRDLHQIGQSYIREFREYMLQKLSITESDSINSHQSRSIYVKRSAGERSVSNADEIETFLTSLGFSIFQLEELDVKEQASAFFNADIIVGAHGAGLANILYSRPGTKVLELLPTPEVRNCFWCLSEKLGLVHSILRCSSTNGFAGVLTVDMHLFKLLMEKLQAS